jgi:hypothetical protein
MEIVENDAHGVIAHRLQPDDADMGPARYQCFLASAMALHFR